MTPTRSWPEIQKFGREIGWPLLASAGLLILLLIAWLNLVISEWSHNPDLSHGFFTPILFVLLINEARKRGSFRYLPAGNRLWGAIALIVTCSAAILVTASLFAAAVEWNHSLVLFLTGASVSGALVAAWLFSASQSVRIVPFNWIILVAILLWMLSVPLPPGTYQRLTLGLQLWVSDRVLDSLHLLGIPAIQNGNIIELARTTVGVEDACSGVRSLLSCIYAGFFFSATYVQRWMSRGAIIVLAPFLAIGMNFIRSLFLTLLANYGTDITGLWHDATGYAILGITAVILGVLAIGLEKLENAHAEPLTPETDSSIDLKVRVGSRILLSGYSFAAICLAVFAFLARPTPPQNEPAPEMLDFLPPEPAGWKIATSNGLGRFADILETDKLGQRSYFKTLPDGEILQVTLYLAYWKPGQAGVSVVATHTPDACWPGAGWTPQPTDVSEIALPLPSRDLSQAEYRIFTNESAPQHVWFWHSYNREVIPEFEPRRPLELLNSVFTYGVRSQGEQLFVRLSSNRPWEEFADEPLLTEIFSRLSKYGI